MDAVLHHVLLGLALLALGHAALRLASRACPAGLERVLAAVVLGVAAAVCQALVLGLVDLGTSTAALCAATAVMWLAALLALPRPELSPLAELAGWWAERGAPARAALGALVGIAVAWTIFQLDNPAIGFDGSVYHYAEVAGWVANGRPGSILALSYDLPYGNYPLTDEVVLAWGAGIARSWVPLSLWNPFMFVVLVLATLVTLRNLRVRLVAAGLATVALLCSPVVIRQLNEPQTDLPTLAWLACTAALASAAGRRPLLLAPAIVAAGLAVGTKTTAAGMVVAALGLGLFLARGRLRPVAGWLAAALVLAVAVGGVWYLRNLVEHGSPLWPFNSGPWGDPRPEFLTQLETSFADRPIDTLDGRLGAYTARLGGIWLLLAGGVAVLIGGWFARDRRTAAGLVAAGGVSLAGLLLWSIAPGTGEQAKAQLLGADWPISTARYVLPAAFAATVAVALATRSRARPAALTLLAGAATWSLVATSRVPYPWTPSVAVVLLGAAGGGLAGLVLGPALGRPPLRGWSAARTRVALTVAGTIALGAALAPASNGFVARHADVRNSSALGRDVIGWFAAQPWFEDGDADIAFVSRSLMAPLAGDHFAHRLVLVPRLASCRRVRAMAAGRPMVVTDPGFLKGFLGIRDFSTPDCLAGRTPAFQDDLFRVFAP